MNNQCLQILIQDTKGAIDSQMYQDIKPKFPNVVDVSFEEHDPRDPQPAGRKVSAFYIAKGPTILLLPDAEFCTILGRLHDAAHASGKMFSYLVIDYPVALEQVGKSNKDIKRDRDGIIELLKKENWKEIHPSFQAGGLMAPAAMTIFAGPV
ncbi:hypothetical protein PsYK624_034680 [Phanerochaete sordida]|uniref:Uncharacterized protein n=1 Tax=Phanerochaete sordida TaxID=48140 RepID=A0A9P3L9Q5_9APHY|nr:hypothetical protein PsYK624_034680 [Phanerochaete sordida]